MIAAKWQRHRKACERCAQMFACKTTAQRFCSRKCAGLAQGNRAESGRKGGQEAGRRKALAAIREMATQWPGMPTEAARFLLELRARWYRMGYKAGSRAGFRKGWADALGEHDGPAPTASHLASARQGGLASAAKRRAA